MERAAQSPLCPLLGQLLLEAARSPEGIGALRAQEIGQGNLKPSGRNAGMRGGAHGMAPMPQPCP